MNESSTKSGPTANNLLSTGETLGLLERLRQAIREIVLRVEQVEREYTGRSNRQTALHEEAISAERERRSSEIEAERVAIVERKQTADAFFATRAQRITRAVENAKKQRLKEIDTDESRRTAENEQQMRDADRKRDEALEKAKSDYATLLGRLEAERAEMDRLEKSARRTLGGYRNFSNQLKNAPAETGGSGGDSNQLLEKSQTQRETAARELARCKAVVLPLVFRVLPVWLCVFLVLLVPFAFVPELQKFDFGAVPAKVWMIMVGGIVAVLALYFGSMAAISSAAKRAIAAFNEARRLFSASAKNAEQNYNDETIRIQSVHTYTTQTLNQQWKQLYAGAKTKRLSSATNLGQRGMQLSIKSEERRKRHIARIEQQHSEELERLPQESAVRTKLIETKHAEEVATLNATLEHGRKAAAADWQNIVIPLLQQLKDAANAADKLFPSWDSGFWNEFNLPENFSHAAKYAELAVDLEKLCEVTLRSDRFAVPDSPQFNVPLLISVPRQASVLFETRQSGQTEAIGALNNLVLRLLTTSVPGRLAFTIFDPVGLGQNFAGIMHLADFEERLISSRIWTQQNHIEQRLADLNEHIEKVTQMYLRNEYETLAEYNAQAGRMAEKYQFLVIADFPTNFSDLAVKRLLSIAGSGPRCGVHVLIHWDQRKPAPTEFVPEELRKNAIRIVPSGNGFALADVTWEGTTLKLDSPPNPELATKLLLQIGRDSRDAYRVEMPFGEAAPTDGEMWSLDTRQELTVPIGRTGATKLQYLALGEGTRQHGLIAGKTGSGKSTLFHVIITNLSLWCSPEQVEFYLVDFKKGVEFKSYATNRLPHARVVAIESDREFGLSVLQRVDEELKRRGDLFRKIGVQDLAGFKKAQPNEPMPRTLLMIDEFQEFFTEDDRISQSAALLLDRIVRQGRAFGIHVLLGSQTLGGAYTLARATIGQMAVRIALQSNEADAYLIMSEDNPAPRLLSRPGEAIYNDDGGSIQGNSPFQVVWLPDEERDEWLTKVRKLAEQKHLADQEPVVFEGNAPANVRENPVLRSLLNAPSVQPTRSPRLWLGAPNSIKGPTEAVFRRQSGNHLLIVGQREESARAMLTIGMISLAVQHPKPSARFFVFDNSPPDSPEARSLERAVRAIPHDARLVPAGEVTQVMSELAAELDRRTDPAVAAATPEIYILIHGLPNNRKLRYDEELSFSVDPSAGAEHPGLLLNKIITEGASVGFHVIATCDTYNNVVRSLSRKAISEFEMRVVFQMSANDSASLIDSGLANNLGLHRAILFNGQQGWMETFRPYALPDDHWLTEAEQKLARIHSSVQ